MAKVAQPSSSYFQPIRFSQTVYSWNEWCCWTSWLLWAGRRSRTIETISQSSATGQQNHTKPLSGLLLFRHNKRERGASPVSYRNRWLCKIGLVTVAKDGQTILASYFTVKSYGNRLLCFIDRLVFLASFQEAGVNTISIYQTCSYGWFSRGPSRENDYHSTNNRGVCGFLRARSQKKKTQMRLDGGTFLQRAHWQQPLTDWVGLLYTAC